MGRKSAHRGFAEASHASVAPARASWRASPSRVLVVTLLLLLAGRTPAEPRCTCGVGAIAGCSVQVDGSGEFAAPVDYGAAGGARAPWLLRQNKVRGCSHQNEQCAVRKAQVVPSPGARCSRFRIPPYSIRLHYSRGVKYCELSKSACSGQGSVLWTAFSGSLF